MELAWGRCWAESLVPAIWIPQAADATLGCMTAEPIDTSTHRLDLLAHLAVCSPCAALFMFAREHQDLGALDAWRRQLAQHLVAGSGLQFVDKGTHALKGVPGEWRLFSVAAPSPVS